MKTNNYTCIIIDDEFHCRELLAYKISKFVADLDILEKISNINDALVYLKNNEAPDIIFLDLELPGVNGFDFLENVKTITSQIIITSAYEKYALKTIKFHVVDFLLKPINDIELVDTIKYVKTKIYKPEILEEIKLTPKETIVLQLMAKGLLNKEIADQINIGLSTVKNHIQNIFQKLKVQNRSEAIIHYLNNKK